MTTFTLIHRIFLAIQHRLPARYKTAELADKLNVSKSHLLHEFKDKTGLTIGQYTQWLVLKNAAKEIANTHHRILDIALGSGFESQEAFSRAFKRQFYLSPKNLKANPEFARFLSSGQFDEIYLQYIEFIKHNPPYLTQQPLKKLIGVAGVFPSISLGRDMFFKELHSLWEKFDETTALWDKTNRNYYAVEYRNCCSGVSGYFQMLVMCDGKVEHETDELIYLELPEQDRWCFTLPSPEYAEAFLSYLYSVFAPKHNLWLGRLPVIWKPQNDGRLHCYVHLYEFEMQELPTSVLHLDKTLQYLPAMKGSGQSSDIPIQCILKSHRISYLFEKYHSNFLAMKEKQGAILIGKQSNHEFTPMDDYHITEWYPNNEGESRIESGSYLHCKMKGTPTELGEDLDHLYHAYFRDSKFYLRRGVEWILDMKHCEDQQWYIELLIPAAKR